MLIKDGTRLGRYQIRSKIGEGGMGQVYLATDTILDRKVALKILPAELAANEDRMRRFVQEAKSAATLNHPNIATIHEIGEEDGTHFIAMEFIDGETLREKIHRDKEPLSKLLKYLAQVAEGLGKAHLAGIVHRDLKPDNIMITRDGYAKILDFGLAKLIEPQKTFGTGQSGSSEVATALMPQQVGQSIPGMVMGTVGYMSPEQAQGKAKEIDHRSDIFSFGCIVFEAATGQNAFAGKDVLDSLHKIVHAPTPQISEFNPNTPDDLQRIVRRCLAKEPDKRFQSIKEVAIELEELQQELKRFAPQQHVTRSGGSAPAQSRVQPSNRPSDQATGTPSQEGTHSATHATSSAEYLVSGIKQHKMSAAIIVAILLVATAAGIYGVYRFAKPKETRGISFQPAKFTRLTTTGKADRAAVSPDGKYVAYVVNDANGKSLWLRQVATASNAQLIPPSNTIYRGLTFSPDGNYLFYVVSQPGAGDVYRQAGVVFQIPSLGGSPRKILADAGGPVSFSPDGKQFTFFRYNIVAGEDLLMIANSDGTGERKLAGRPQFYSGFGQPSWSPDGKTIACSAGDLVENYMTVVVVQVSSGAVEFFTPQKWQIVEHVAWLSDNRHILFTAIEKGTILRQMWQVSYPSGEVQKVINDLNSYNELSITANSDALVSVQHVGSFNIWVMPVNDSARAVQISQSRDRKRSLIWTHDGQIMYYASNDEGVDLYVTKPGDTEPRRLTVNSGRNFDPAVCPDGRYIFFASDRGGGPQHIWRMDADGSNPKQLTNATDMRPQCSADGQWIYYTSIANNFSLWKVPVDGGDPVPVHTGGQVIGAALSPDGKEIACNYQESGGTASVLTILSAVDGSIVKTFDAQTQPANNRGEILKWTADGRGILYVDEPKGGSNLWIQPRDGGPPKQLTDFTSDHIVSFAMSPDGRQLALSRGIFTDDVVMISNSK